jgi:trimeric autotransporter adhesin
MKRTFTVLALVVSVICMLVLPEAVAQSPQKMSYQCVVRNSSGELVTNQTVGIKISILQASATGTVVFSETYNPNPQTNANGLVSLEIGGGTPASGTFSSINWASGLYFLKTETDPTGGTNYTITGTSQLLSVPYALHAKSVEGYDSTDVVTISGNQTIEGIKTFSRDIKVLGITIGTGNGSNNSNTAIGRQTLYSNTWGFRNTSIGTNSLYSNTTGSFNTAVGHSALYSDTTGEGNIAVGPGALYSITNGGNNIAVGFDAFPLCKIGCWNTIVGNAALLLNTTGFQNTVLGFNAGFYNETGSKNIFLGCEAGYYETGSNKLYIDNSQRSNESEARAKSLIYGVFDSDPANQVLNVNGTLNAFSLNGVSFFIKDGNNGTVSGDTFCKGSEWGRVGACIAVKRLDTGEYIPTAAVANTPVTCLCASF